MGITKKRLAELKEKEKQLDAINENSEEEEGLKKEDLTGDTPSIEVNEASCDSCGHEFTFEGNPPIACPSCKEKFE